MKRKKERQIIVKQPVPTQVERTPVCTQTEITGSGRNFERATVCTMVRRWSDQKSIWSEKSNQRRLRAQLGLIITSSSALGFDQNCF